MNTDQSEQVISELPWLLDNLSHLKSLHVRSIVLDTDSVLRRISDDILDNNELHDTVNTYNVDSPLNPTD